MRAAAIAEPKAEKVEGPIVLDGQVLHSIEPARLDIIRSMEADGWVEEQLTRMLKPVEKCWQPADMLPDGADPDFLDKARRPLPCATERRPLRPRQLVLRGDCVSAVPVARADVHCCWTLRDAEVEADPGRTALPVHRVKCA